MRKNREDQNGSKSDKGGRKGKRRVKVNKYPVGKKSASHAIVLNRRQRKVMQWARGVGSGESGIGVGGRGIDECEKLGLLKVVNTGGGANEVKLTELGKSIPEIDIL